MISSDKITGKVLVFSLCYNKTFWYHCEYQLFVGPAVAGNAIGMTY